MSVEILSRAAVDMDEEMLLTEVPILRVDPTLTASFYCGMDCGSTQTRSVCMPTYLLNESSSGEDDASGDIEEWFRRFLVIPSISKSVPLTMAIKARSNLLFDNLDSVFSINGKEEIRLVRGSRINDVESAQKELVASTKKVTSEVILFNVVDAIGYNLVENAARTGEDLPARVELDLVVALPPDDMLEKEIASFRDKLKRFTWIMSNRMQGCIEITIRTVAAYAEPTAQIQAYFTFSGEDAPEEALLLESGGRNSSPVIFMNGAPTGSGLRSIEQSGVKLLDRLGIKYMEKFGGKVPNRRLLEQAIRTGKMKYGNDTRDVVDLIKECKDEVAEDLFQRLQSEVISRQSAVTLESLNLILFSGRVYQAGDYHYSVANKLKSLIQAVSPATEVKIVDKNRIPQGLVLLYLLDKVLAE